MATSVPSATFTNSTSLRYLEPVARRPLDVSLEYLSTVAERLGYSSKYLSHIFKKQMGMGYTEYLQTYRIRYAVSLFEHGLDSIKNVALLSGFTDPLYFSTVFKKQFGVSPASYIQKIQNKR